MYVYRTSGFNSKAELYSLQERIDDWCVELETQRIDEVQSRFERVYPYLKRRILNRRLIARILRVDNEQILCLLDIFKRGDNDYEQFLEDPETKALRYHDSLSIMLAWWANHFGAEKVLELNVLKLREARDRLRKGRSHATVNRYLSALRSCWNWGRASGLVPQDQLWPTRLMLKEDNERQRYLTDDELTRLIQAAKAHSTTMFPSRATRRHFSKSVRT